MTDTLTNGQDNTSSGQQAASTNAATTEAKPTLGSSAATATETKPADAAASTAQTTTQATTTTAETPKAGEATGDNKQATDANKEAEKVTGAPETYAEFTLPEGIKQTPVLAEFQKLAKEANLDQATAQKFADLGSKLALENGEQSKTIIGEARKTWASEVKSDKEYGGDKLGENLATANRGLAAYGSPALVSLLQQSGLEDHPEVIRVFWKVGQTVSADRKFVSATGSATGEKSAAQVLFPSMKSVTQ